ncbi:MAG: site-2 protease family protein [Nitrospinae bacterium]|nr:site-2 protease family protein [Nitrospinota bacterium]
MEQNKLSHLNSDENREPNPVFDPPVLPVKKNWWLFSILLLATLLTTFLAGGPLFSISLLLILGAHEFGHYWASRKNGVQSTLPYFIPAPPIFIAGTFGAFIQIKQRIPNRRVLMEIGAAGPIAGFVVALPMLMVGLHLSSVSPSTGIGGISYGSSYILNLCSEMILGVDPSSPYINIHLHPIAFAGWIGMLVTALNLMPVGQLDGGHIIYAIFPDKHSAIGKLFFLALFPLGYFWPGWIFWAVMISLMGFKTAPLDEDVGGLESFHKIIGVFTMIIFLLTFIPVPFSEI